MTDKLRSVNTRFWGDPFIEQLNPSEKLLFLYLLTNPLSNLLGVYEITIKRICYDTSLTKETVTNGLKRFEKDKKAFYKDNFIILPNWLKNQRLNSNMKIAVAKEFSALPNELKDNILGNGSESLSNGSKGFEMIRECLGKYEIEIEVESEPKKEDIETVLTFDQFWELYDKKVEKKKSELKYSKVKEKDRVLIKEHIPKYKAAQPDKNFRKNPETYLNNESWNDEIIQRNVTPVTPIPDKLIIRPLKYDTYVPE